MNSKLASKRKQIAHKKGAKFGKEFLLDIRKFNTN